MSAGLLGAGLSSNHISPEGQMSLLGLPIPVPGLYAKNNLNDGWRHRAVSTVCDRDPDKIITAADLGIAERVDGRRAGCSLSWNIPELHIPPG